jgi:hypothetical protein
MDTFKKNYNSLKVFILIVLSLFCLISFKSYTLSENTVPQVSKNGLKVGDYVEFGRYHGKPILWRVIALEDGKPLLYSDRILALKSFDAKGSSPRADQDSNRYREGSNFWEASTLRTWLNSERSSQVFVGYPYAIPNVQNVWDGINAYSDEPGFLSNFTAEERANLLERSHKVLLDNLDAIEGVKIGGDQSHIFDRNFNTALSNYDQANFHIVTDRVFLLSVKEFIEYVSRDEDIYRAFPTDEAVYRSNYQDDGLNTQNNWNYWLRTPSPRFGHQVRTISNWFVTENQAYFGINGVRPAILISSEIEIGFGEGTNERPYRFFREGINLFDEFKDGVNETYKILSEETEAIIARGQSVVREFRINDSLIDEALWAGYSLTVEDDLAQIKIPQGTIKNEMILKEGEEISIQFQRLEKRKEEEIFSFISNQLGDVVKVGNLIDFSMLKTDKEGNKENIQEFSQPLEITLKNIRGFNDISRTSVYNVIFKFDDIGNLTDMEYFYVGGEIQGTDINFQTDHFSFYIVMERKASFPDVLPDHWSRRAVETLSSRGIIKGYPTGGFLPNNSVNRVDFSIMLNNSIGRSPVKYWVAFKDIKPNDYFAGHVLSLNKYGITDVRSDVLPSMKESVILPSFGVYNEDQMTYRNITREETAIFIVQGYNYLKTFRSDLPNLEPKELSFKDKNEISSEIAKDYISIANQLGIMKGYPDGTFGPKRTLTRAEAAQSIMLFMSKFNSGINVF